MEIRVWVRISVKIEVGTRVMLRVSERMSVSVQVGVRVRFQIWPGGVMIHCRGALWSNCTMAGLHYVWSWLYEGSQQHIPPLCMVMAV